MVDFRELMITSSRANQGFSWPEGSEEYFLRPRYFEHLASPSGVRLSVQASFNHYCVPRRTLEASEYESFELAVFDEQECMCAVVDVLGESSNFAKSFEPHSSGPVYGNVPVAKIQRLCEALGIVG